MKKLFLLLICFAITAFASVSFSQFPQWSWVKSSESNNSSYLNASVMDVSGNIFMVGSFYTDTMLFDGYKIVGVHPPSESNNCFIIKMAHGGKIEWAKAIYTTQTQYHNMYTKKLLVDKDGFLTVIMNAQNLDTISINGEQVIPLKGFGQSEKNIILKFTNDGQFVALKQLVGSMGGYISMMDAVLDDPGNLYITGILNTDTAFIDNITLLGHGSSYSDMFVTKFDKNGNPQWAVTDSASSPVMYKGSNPDAIAVSPAGSIVIVGSYTGPGRNFGADQTTNVGADDVFIASVDASGNPLFLKSYGGDSTDIPTALKIDPAGNIYIAGRFQSNVFFIGTNEIFNSSAPLNDIFIMKCNPLGDPVWGNKIACQLSYPPNNIASLGLLSDNSVIISTLFANSYLYFGVGKKGGIYNRGAAGTTDIIIGIYTPDGQEVDAISFGSRSSDNVAPIYIDSKDNIWFSTNVSSFIPDSFLIDTTYYNLGYEQPGFVIGKVPNSWIGIWSTAVFVPAPYETLTGGDLLLERSGSVYFDGYYRSIGINFGPYILGPTLYEQFFLSKLGYTISGHIYDPATNSISSGTVKLYHLVPNARAELIDSLGFGEGTYSFSDAPARDFLIYAEADPGAYPDLIGTYSGNSSLWENATILDVDSINPASYDIHLNQISPMTGTGIINGTVTFQETITKGAHLKSIMGRPMKGASVVLVGKSTKSTMETILAVTVTDDLGYYEFTKVPDGDYEIRVQVTGLPQPDIRNVTISAATQSISNVNYIVTDNGIYFDSGQGIVKPGSSVNKILKVYPNPTKDIIYLRLNDAPAGKVWIEILSVTGQTVKQMQAENIQATPLPIDISSLPSGIYSLRLRFSDKIYQSFVAKQ